MRQNILKTGFDTRPIIMEPMWLIACQAPVDDVDRIFEAIINVTPLQHRKSDQTAFRSGSGVEYYRPLEGSPTGAENGTRRRPEVDEPRFFLPRDA